MGAPPCQRFETSIAKPKQNHNFAELHGEEAANSAGGNCRGCQERPRNTENRRGRRASQRVSPAGSPLEGERGSNVFSQHKPKTSFTSALANRWLQHRAHPFTQHVFPLRDSCVFCACFVTLKPGWNAGQQCRRVPPRSIPPPAQNSARREVGRRARKTDWPCRFFAVRLQANAQRSVPWTLFEALRRVAVPCSARGRCNGDGAGMNWQRSQASSPDSTTRIARRWPS